MSKLSRKTQTRNTRKLSYWLKKNRVTIFALGVVFLLIFLLGLFLQKRLSTKSRAESADSYNTIIGGRDADPADWEFFVQIMEGGQPICGGAIIDPQWVITAAHCVADYYKQQETNKVNIANNAETDNGRRFVLQTTKTDKNNFRFWVYKEEIYIHEDYFSDHKNDLALIRVSSNEVTRFRQIRLPPRGFRLEGGAPVRLAGYGDTKIIIDESGNEIDSEIPDKLQEVEFPYGFEISDDKLILIAQDNKTPCFGDSGGPLVYNDAPRGAYIIGIVKSASPNCPLTRNAHNYVNIQHYLNWITEVTGIPTL